MTGWLLLAIRRIDEKGEVFGFLGPSGARKTTTINMLTGLTRLDAGTIHIAEIDCFANPKAAQHLMGVVPDESNLYPELTGYDDLCLCGALYVMRKPGREAPACELLDRFRLAGAAGRRFAGSSRAEDHGAEVAEARMLRPLLEEVFIQIAGIEAAAMQQEKERPKNGGGA